MPWRKPEGQLLSTAKRDKRLLEQVHHMLEAAACSEGEPKLLELLPRKALSVRQTDVVLRQVRGDTLTGGLRLGVAREELSVLRFDPRAGGAVDITGRPRQRRDASSDKDLAEPFGGGREIAQRAKAAEPLPKIDQVSSPISSLRTTSASATMASARKCDRYRACASGNLREKSVW
jgi:hypothetical protein